MKKIVMVVAAAAVFGIPLFAQNKIGKVTGIQVKDNEAVVSIAEGLINPFEEGGFTKSGDASVTVPLDVAVEFYFPRMAKAPEGIPEKDADAKKKGDDKSERPEMPKLEVKNLKIDQLVQVVYAEDGKTVSKIQAMPVFSAPVHPMTKAAFSGKPDGNRFCRSDRSNGNNGSGRFWGKDPAHQTRQGDRR
ncbi:MAG: hypothetical protein II837_09375 [Treponema sp.]|nr:hypothetical protein [Treponema sp.]